jgi:tripartite ATP-independent transporter DctP family solute receptor
MSITRRSLLVGAGAGLIASPFAGAFGQKAEFNYKFAHNMPVTHPVNMQATAMADALRSETNGRLDLQVFPNSQLGNDTDTLSQLRSGGVEFFSLSGLILQTLVPAAGINGVGFAFPDYAAVWKAMDGDLGAHIRKEISKKGLIAMDRIWDNGFRQITTSTRPISKAEDLKGMKIRVPPSPMWTSVFKSLDASPTSINFAEVYSALQTKIVEAQENPLAIISTAKLYEVQKYLSITNHMWDGYWMLANRKAFERLPAEIQKLVAAKFNETALKERADTEALNANLQIELAAKGMIINQADTASLRAKLRSAGYYAEWKTKFGDEAWAVLERYTGNLT